MHINLAFVVPKGSHGEIPKLIQDRLSVMEHPEVKLEKRNTRADGFLSVILVVEAWRDLDEWELQDHFHDFNLRPETHAFLRKHGLETLGAVHRLGYRGLGLLEGMTEEMRDEISGAFTHFKMPLRRRGILSSFLAKVSSLV